jgi:hypothetical protein
VGVGRDVIAEPAKLEIPNLTLYVSRAMGADFEGWANDFLIKGNSSDEKEKSGAIWLADSGGKEVARLALSHVGISGLTTDPGDPSRYKVSLYVEGMRFSIGGAKAKERKAVNLAAAKVAPTSESKVVPAKATKK